MIFLTPSEPNNLTATGQIVLNHGYYCDSCLEIMSDDLYWTLSNEDAMEFHNQCHNKADGKFCKGPDGAGRIREIKDPEKRAAAEKEAKEFIKAQKKEQNAGRDATRKAFEKAETSRTEIGDTVRKTKITPAQDKREKELESAKAQTLEDFHNSTNFNDRLSNLNKYVKTSKELNDHRSSIYTKDQLDRIEKAEDAANQLNTLKNSPRVGEFQKGIFEKSGKYWSDEVTRAKEEARGKKIELGTQKLGTTFDKKTGEWPKSDAQPPRKIETIAQAGKLRRVEVDGVKVKRAYEITAANGDKIRVYDMKGGSAKGNDKLMNQAAAMHELYPQSPPRKLVLMNNKQTIRMTGGRLGGFIFPGDDNVFINKDEVPHFTASAKRGWMMPIGKTTDPGEYVYTHEFGHQYDANNRRNGGRAMYENPEIKKTLSTYGKTIPEEGYAEAFAEWHMSKGQTDNPAARAYAKQEKWYGHDRIVQTAAGAKKYGVPIGSAIPEGESLSWDPWQIAIDTGIITFELKENDLDVEDETDEDGINQVPSSIPVIGETWDPSEQKKLKNYPTMTRPATKEEREEADKIVKELLSLDKTEK